MHGVQRRLIEHVGFENDGSGGGIAGLDLIAPHVFFALHTPRCDGIDEGDRAGFALLIGPVPNASVYSQGSWTFLERRTYGYDSAKRLNSEVRKVPSSGAEEVSANFTFHYDSQSQLERVVRWNSGDDGWGENFSYDTAGNRISATERGAWHSGGTSDTYRTTYTANNLNQYTSISNPNVLNVRGTIPPGGSVTVNGQAPDRTDGTVFTKTLPVNNASASQWIPVTVTKTPASGSPVSVTTTNFVPAATETLSYDLDGNLISDGQFVYAYDGENRLILVESRAGTPRALKRQIHYSYDGEGRLIRRYVNREMSYEYMPGAEVTWWAVMESHRYLHDGWMCLAEYAPSGSDQLRLFVWGHDLSGTRGGAGGIGGLCMIHDSVKGPLFLGADRMGNIVHTVSGSTGNLVATTEYRSFGDVVEGPTGSMVPGFSSKLRDSSSGMNYFGFRWYGSKHGRWVYRDPLGDVVFLEQRLVETRSYVNQRKLTAASLRHPYQFVINNPTAFVDPVGLRPEPGSTRNRPEYDTQHDAAKSALDSINKTSKEKNIEHCGLICRTCMGRFIYTGPVKGTIASCQPMKASCPVGTMMVAYWHTHGGFDERYDSENFSQQDLDYADYFGIDAYVGTPRDLLNTMIVHKIRWWLKKAKRCAIACLCSSFLVGCTSMAALKDCGVITDSEKAIACAEYEAKKQNYSTNNKRARVRFRPDLQQRPDVQFGVSPSEVKGRKLVSVYWAPKEMVLGGTFAVLLDAHTGEVVASVKGR